jgi:aryl-alcohol dehydrogenase-like predicted oxidoreductase
MNPHTNRICLGTAQFGFDYGIANTQGRMTDENIKSVLGYAAAHGIKVLDTASAYGTSEEMIGRSLKHLNRSLDIISKLPSYADEKAGPREIIMRSLKRLDAKKIYGYLLHSFEDFRKPDIWQELNALKSEGVVGKIGFSLYRPEEAEMLLDSDTAFDLVQVPYSVFDRRFAKYLPLFKKRGVEVYARSVFLQGLAFLDPARLPAAVNGARAQVGALRKISAKEGITLSALCLNFALLNPDISRVIIGVDNPDHLKVNLSDLRFFARTKAVGEDFNAVVIEDEDILLPYRWKK